MKIVQLIGSFSVLIYLLIVTSPAVALSEKTTPEKPQPAASSFEFFDTLNEYQDAKLEFESMNSEKIAVEAELKQIQERLEDLKLDQDSKKKGLTNHYVQHQKLVLKEPPPKNKIKEILDVIYKLQDEIKQLTLSIQNEEKKHSELSKRNEELLKIIDESREEVKLKKRKYDIVRNKFIKKIVLFALFILSVFLIRFFVIRGATKYISESSIKYNIKRVSNITIIILFVLLGLFFFVENISLLATVLGFASAGIAIALQDVFTSFVGWFVLVSSRGLRKGDRVQVGDMIGDVIDIGVLRTMLLEVGSFMETDQDTGRVVLLANNFVFKNPVFNYNIGHNYVWSKIDILVTLTSNLEKAKSLLLAIIEENSKKDFEVVNREMVYMMEEYHIVLQEKKPFIYTTIEPSGINFSMRYMTEANRVLSTKNKLTLHVIEAFKKQSDIEFAYPTQTVHVSKTHQP